VETPDTKKVYAYGRHAVVAGNREEEECVTIEQLNHEVEFAPQSHFTAGN